MESPKVREQLDYSYVITRQILRCVEAEDEVEFEANVRRLVALIPQPYRDERFREEMEEARYVEKVAIPAKFAGVEVLNNPSIPPMEEEVEMYDWATVFEACINLFDRIGLLLKRLPREIFMGIRFDDARALAKRLMEERMTEEMPDEVEA